MHVMFIHPAFPAQFGLVAEYLAREHGWPCTYLTSVDTSHLQLPFAHLNYHVKPGPLPKIFYPTGKLQDGFEHMRAVYRGLRSAPQIQPDVVVGHMFFGTMLYLKNLYRCPFVGYFEWMPPPFWSEELALRPDFPPPEEVRLCQAIDHTLTLLHLNVVDAAYTPTRFQISTAPAEFRHKLRVIHDGFDLDFNRRKPVERPCEFRGVKIPAGKRVITYVSPGLESWRGFDIFMKVAKQIYARYDDAIFLIAGEDRTQYGYEMNYVREPSFKQHVLAQDHYELDRFHFLGLIPPSDLITMFSLSDLHVYLTVPFVCSWSVLQAMACGCTVLGSATAPLMEIIDHNEQGLLAGFYDVERLSELAIEALREPARYGHLGAAARQRMLDRYEKRQCIEQLAAMLIEVTGAG